MPTRALLAWWGWSAPVVFVLSSVATAVAGLSQGRSAGQFAVMTAALLPSVLVGALITWRVPASPVGGALSWVGGAASVALCIGTVADAVLAPDRSSSMSFGDSVWPVMFLGLLALALVFPDGLLPGRRWRVIAVLTPAAVVFLTLTLALDADNFSTNGGPLPGPPLLVLPESLRILVMGLGFGLFLSALVAAATALVVRFRRGDAVTRLRVRWLMLAVAALPVLMAVSWVSLLLGNPGGGPFDYFLLLELVLLPACVAIAILRHDLFDVDRLLGEGLAWLLTTVVSAAIFAAAVLTAGEVFGRDATVGVAGAAFVAALCLLPLHRVLVEFVGRFVDRDRYVVRAKVRQFVAAVRDGAAEPEAVEGLLRGVLDDPTLRVLLCRPGASTTAFVDMTGLPAVVEPSSPQVPLRTRDVMVGTLVLGAGSARRLRRAREVAIEARLPIEVSRLRLELRGAVDDVRASRARLAQATEEERRRLERDLHDGAQQQILAIGMQLRSAQRRLDPTDAMHSELDRAVAALEDTVGELRRLAHGVRPARLDNGLAAGLRDLVRHSAVPVDLDVADVEVPDLVATTVYFVVAEALTNAHKHGRAHRVQLTLANSGGTVRACVRDDGAGGATEGFGITSLRDRVASAGGELWVSSPLGVGTEVRVELPCGS